MKQSIYNNNLKSISVYILILFSICSVSIGQISPHPKLLMQIQADKTLAKTIPNFDNSKDLVKKGIDAPWSAPELLLSKKILLNKFQRTYGPAKTPTGNWNALVLLVKFSDKPSKTEPSFFDPLLFGTQFGSMRDYYKKVSYNQLDIVTLNLPGTTGWYIASQNYSYYVDGQNGFGQYPKNAQKLVEEVIQLADPTVDFSKYDNDKDGFVDALFIVHTGSGAEYSGSKGDIWSHAWEVKNILNVDGVKVSKYSMEPEYWETPGDMTMGVYAHELGHAAFGVPDLYDRDYSSQGIGKWSLMAAGSWNGTAPGGNYPAFPDAWTHAQMGYLNPTVITENILAKSIPQIELNSSALLLSKGGIISTEYYLLENRQKIDYDKYIPGDGLLIYHVDENIITQNDKEWYPGLTQSQHFIVALEQADGKWDLEKKINNGDAADPFPGTKNQTNFTRISTPDIKDYFLTTTGLAVKNIGLSESIMLADLEVSSVEKILNVVTPNGGENLAVGYSKPIIIDGLNSGPVFVEYTTDNGSTWSPIGNVNPSVNLDNNEIYSSKKIELKSNFQQNIVGDLLTWIVPNTPSKNCRIRATSTSNSSLTDLSDNTFSIVPTLSDQFTVQFNYEISKEISSNGSLGAIYIPSINEFWTSRIFDKKIHRWSKTGNLIGELNINGVNAVLNFAYDGTNVFAVQDGSMIIKIINPLTKTVIGEISTSPNQISYITFDPNADNSNGGFWIGTFNSDPRLIDRNGTVLRSVPYSKLGSRDNIGIAHDNYSPGGPYLWFSSQSPYQKLIQVKLSTGLPTGIEHDLATDVGANTSNLMSGGIFVAAGIINNKVTIGGMLQGWTNNLYGFQLCDLVPNITVTYPNGGEKLKVGSQNDITWSSGLVDKIKIEYSATNGLEWLPISENTTASLGKFPWIVPNNLSANCKIRITDQINSALLDLSDDNFLISKTGVIPEIEPNNTLLQAMNVVYDDTVNANIMPTGGDVDYYRIQGVAGDTLMFYAEVRNDSQLIGNMGLLDQNGNFINKNIQSFNQNSYKQRFVYILPNTAPYFIRYSFINNMNGIKIPNDDIASLLKNVYSTNSMALDGPPNYFGDYRIIFSKFQKAAPLAGRINTNNLNYNSTRFDGKFISNGLPTTATIEYGTTTNYGSSVMLANGVKSFNESEGSSDKVSGLTPNSVYHYRMKVENNMGIAYTGDYTLTTPAVVDGWTFVESPNTSSLKAIQFYDSYVGYSFGPWVWLKTSDGGVTWVAKGTNFRYNTMEVLSASNVFAIGPNGIISKTTDGGTTWIDQQNVGSNNLAVSFKDLNNGVVVTSNGELYKTSNGGTLWYKMNHGVVCLDLNVVKYFSNNTIIAAGRGRYVIRSTNDGISWSSQQLDGNSLDLISMSFKDLNYGIIAGGSGMMFKTTDGGASWVKLNSIHNNSIFGINYQSNGIVVTVGQGGTIYKSDNDGETWIQQQSGTSNTLYSISNLSNSSTLFSAGDWGTILKYSLKTTVNVPPAKPVLISPAISQTDQPNSVTFKWNKIIEAEKYFVQLSKDQTFSIIGKNDSTAIDTSKIISNLSEGLKYYWQVQAKNNVGVSPWSDVWNFTTILLAPTNLTLLRSALKEIKLMWNDNSSNEDGYVIERKQSPSATFSFLDTLKGSGNNFIDKNVEQGFTYSYRTKAYTKFAVSNFSNEASIVVVGIDEKKIPTEYSISQNFPNPFNPSSVIKYGIPSTSFVTLKIYDLLGREVTQLINDEKQPGYYEVKFDGSYLSSGLYFYRIQAKDFIQTKKMILIK